MRNHAFKLVSACSLLTMSLPTVSSQSTSTTTNSTTTTTTTGSITRQVLQAVPIQALPGYESRMVRLEYPPGAKSPVHNHPVPGTGYVVSGDVLSQFEGGEVEIHHEGESFVDLGLVPHLRVENLNHDKPFVIVMNYVIPIGEANVKTLVDNEPGGI